MYRYLLCDLLTDQVVAELPLSGVSFDRRISRTGSLSGSIEASSPELVRIAKLAHAYAGRSALWVLRGEALWWGGIPWTVIPTQAERGPVRVSISAATFDSYAHHRRLYRDKGYVATDQGVIIPDLWREIQSDAAGDIGVVAEDQPTGVTRDRTYLAQDHPYVGKLIEDMGDVIDGPEHTIDVFMDNGVRTKRLRVARHLGSTQVQHVFERASRSGGRIIEWEKAADAVDGGTAFQAKGNATGTEGNAGEAAPVPMSDLVERTDLLDAGWPRLDVSEDYSDVTRLSTLNGYAQGMAATRGGAIPTSGYTVDVTGSGWNPNRVGDLVRLRLRDEWHDTVTDLTVRPVGCEVTPAEKGQPERVKLLFGED